MRAELIFQKRNAKAIPHLEQYAPVWLINEQVNPQSDNVLFEVVFQHPYYGWVNRRYRYDAFNDVLYYLGETVVPEEKAVEIQEQQPPFIEALVSDIPHAYGG